MGGGAHSRRKRVCCTPTCVGLIPANMCCTHTHDGDLSPGYARGSIDAYSAHERVCVWGGVTPGVSVCSTLTCGASGNSANAASIPWRLGGLWRGASATACWISCRTLLLRPGGGGSSHATSALQPPGPGPLPHLASAARVCSRGTPLMPRQQHGTQQQQPHCSCLARREGEPRHATSAQRQVAVPLRPPRPAITQQPRPATTQPHTAPTRGTTSTQRTARSTHHRHAASSTPHAACSRYQRWGGEVGPAVHHAVAHAVDPLPKPGAKGSGEELRHQHQRGAVVGHRLLHRLTAPPVVRPSHRLRTGGRGGGGGRGRSRGIPGSGRSSVLLMG